MGYARDLAGKSLTALNEIIESGDKDSSRVAAIRLVWDLVKNDTQHELEERLAALEQLITARDAAEKEEADRG